MDLLEYAHPSKKKNKPKFKTLMDHPWRIHRAKALFWKIIEKKKFKHLSCLFYMKKTSEHINLSSCTSLYLYSPPAPETWPLLQWTPLPLSLSSALLTLLTVSASPEVRAGLWAWWLSHLLLWEQQQFWSRSTRGDGHKDARSSLYFWTQIQR